MKAIAQDEFGCPGSPRAQGADKPAIQDGEVFVRVRAAPPNPWTALQGLRDQEASRPQAGWLNPRARCPGSDMAGKVEAVGKDVTLFRRRDHACVQPPVLEREYRSFMRRFFSKEACLDLRAVN